MAPDYIAPTDSERLRNEIDHRILLAHQQSVLAHSQTHPCLQPSETSIYKQRCERAMHLATMLADFAEFHDLPAPYQKSLAKLVRVLDGTE